MRNRKVSDTVRRVENEYGEPIADVIAGFADMGYSQTDTAGALDVTFSHFRWLLAALNVRADWQGSGSPLFGEKVGAKTKARINAWAETARRERDRHAFWYAGYHDTLKGHARRLGIKERTVYARRHKKPDAGPSYWLRPVEWRAPVNRIVDGHAWREDAA